MAIKKQLMSIVQLADGYSMLIQGEKEREFDFIIRIYKGDEQLGWARASIAMLTAIHGDVVKMIDWKLEEKNDE